MSGLRFVGRTVRSLKRRYAVTVEFLRPTTNQVDTATGQVTRAYNSFGIIKALVLPTDIFRSFKYSLSFVAANKNFTYGGNFDVANVILLVEYKDFNNLTPQVDDQMKYLNRRWELKKIDEWADAQCFEIKAEECKGDKND